MSFCSAALVLLLTVICNASERKFDVKDDIFAFPQYDVAFPPTYFLRDEAIARLQRSGKHSPLFDDSIAQAEPSKDDFSEDDDFEYEYMVGNGKPYLCTIPKVEPLVEEEVEERSEEEKKHDLVAAAARGWDLLQDLEGKQCLYYTTGWWSYAFCYNSHVKQFHGLNYGPNGARVWPPQEDSTTPSYILGKYNTKAAKKQLSDGQSTSKVGELQTQAETTYLVQKFEDGTPCDLTGKPRKIEVQYHCNPQSTDRIGWIKETTTCAYLMVVYIPKLCNDVAFQPPKEARLHPIECHEILTEEQVTNLKSQKPDTSAVSEDLDQRLKVGNIEIGSKKIVGADGKKLEKGRIVMTQDERAEVVVMKKDGLIQGLSSTEMKKLSLNPEDIEAFQKELQKLAGSKDWKIERLGNVNGQVELRGMVDDGSKDKKEKEKEKEKKITTDAKKEEDTEVGSKETFKEEI